MKQNYLLGFLVFFLLQISLSQDWVLQHPFSVLSTIRDVEMHPDGKGYAVGDDGTILVTSNFGNQWELKETPHVSPYRFVHSMTGTNGQLVLAGGQKMARSDDFGATWVSVAPSLSNIQSFHSLDENIVYLTTIQQGVHKSTDGGLSWTEIENVPGTNHEDVYFFDENNGIVMADVGDDYRFLTTSDGGTNWTEQTTGYPFLQRMDFATDLIGFAVGPLTTIKTTDGGQSWTELVNSPEGSKGVFAINADTIWTLRGLGYNFSNDGGETWSDHGSPNGGGNTEGIFALDGQNIWITQANTSVKYTSDGGETWSDQVGGPKGFISAIDMLNDQEGFAGGGDMILRTNNGGAIWEPFPVIENTIINDIKMIDQNKLLVVGRGGLLLSTDRGENWSEVPNLDTWWEELHYFSDDKIILGNISGEIWKVNITGDQATLVQDLGSQINGIDFTDDMKGITITRDGLIFRTSDGGDSWSEVFDNQGELSTVKWVTNDILLVTRRFDQNILRSSDSGDTWDDVNLTRSTFWGELSFYDDMNGYLAGGSAVQGIIMRTRDAGLTWETEYSSTTSFQAIDAPSPGEQLAWAVGNGGQIIRYSDCNIAPNLTGLNQSNLICSQDTVDLEVTFEGVDIFEWTVPSDFTIIGNDASARIQLLMGETSGTVSVIGRNSCGDETEILMTTLAPLPNQEAVISQDETTLTCETNAVVFQWFKDGQAIIGANTSVFTATETGSYTVVITSANGCQSPPSNAIDIVITSVIEFQKLGIEVFPNPVNTELFIQGLLDNDKVEFYNIGGHQIQPSETNRTHFRVDDLEPGFYVLRILRDGRKASMKVVVY